VVELNWGIKTEISSCEKGGGGQIQPVDLEASAPLHFVVLLQQLFWAKMYTSLSCSIETELINY
jgi:hypothetical protein